MSKPKLVVAGVWDTVRKLEAGLGANRVQLALPGRGKGSITWDSAQSFGQRTHPLSLRQLSKLPIQRI